LGTIHFYHWNGTGAMAERKTASLTITGCQTRIGKDEGSIWLKGFAFGKGSD
jgi:hypothetical protein